MSPFTALRRLDDRVMGQAPVTVPAHGSLRPYVLAGVLCAGLPALAVVLAGGSPLVAALLPVLGLLPIGIALLMRPVAGRHRGARARRVPRPGRFLVRAASAYAGETDSRATSLRAASERRSARSDSAI